MTRDSETIYDPANTLVWGPGLLDADPCFADSGYWDANGTPEDPNDDFFVEGDYHFKSQAGRWDPGSASWVQDDVTSPCIDGGDINGDCKVDFKDLVILLNHWLQIGQMLEE